MTDSYVLRSLDDTELLRLRGQHDAWKTETDQVLARVGWGPGSRLADLGCGPGFLSLELAERVGPEGSVHAIDLSERFIAFLDAEVHRFPQLCPRVADARALDASPDSLDGAICRWLLMFLPDPERVLHTVARALRPGGIFVAMEYAHFRTISLWPDGRAFRRTYDAVHELIAGSGGNADVGARVPALAVEAGLEVLEIIPFWRIDRPGSTLWRWLSSVNSNHRKLIEADLVTPEDLEDFQAEWDRHSADPNSFLTAPPLLVTIARKP